MKLKLAIFATLISCTCLNMTQAATTQRLQQLSNEKVSVWSTVINPGKEQTLPMHRHNNPRVLIALTDGVLKITNDKGESHDLTLKKDHAYYFKADAANEMHKDENISRYPVKVMVVELR